MADPQYPIKSESPPIGVIYTITNKFNGKQYVGQTMYTIKKRWRQHLTYVQCGKDTVLCRAIRKYGEDAFVIEEIAHTNSQEHLNELEKMFIKNLNTIAPNGYNLTSGGSHHSVHPETRIKISSALTGRNLSVETKMKISKSKMGNQCSRGHIVSDAHKAILSAVHKHKRLSEEHKMRLSISNLGNQNSKGKRHSEETKIKISLANKGNRYGVGNKNRRGKKHTEESKLKMSVAHMGRKHTEESKAKMRISQRRRRHGKEDQCPDSVEE